jgi:hypothetical protein
MDFLMALTSNEWLVAIYLSLRKSHELQRIRIPDFNSTYQIDD